MIFKYTLFETKMSSLSNINPSSLYLIYMSTCLMYIKQLFTLIIPYLLLHPLQSAPFHYTYVYILTNSNV